MPIPGSITDGLMDQEGVIGIVGPFCYPSRATFKTRSSVVDTTGQPIVSYIAKDERHTNVPCRRVPLVLARPRDIDVASAVHYADADFHLTIWGYFDDLQANDVVEVDGVDHRIVGIEWDGNHITTRCFITDKRPYND